MAPPIHNTSANLLFIFIRGILLHQRLGVLFVTMIIAHGHHNLKRMKELDNRLTALHRPPLTQIRRIDNVEHVEPAQHKLACLALAKLLANAKRVCVGDVSGVGKSYHRVHENAYKGEKEAANHSAVLFRLIAVVMVMLYENVTEHANRPLLC